MDVGFLLIKVLKGAYENNVFKTEEKLATGAQLLLEALEKEGVEVIFGYHGGAVLPLYDALYDCEIPHILTRHEQGAIHAAEGYARITGNPGLSLQRVVEVLQM